MKRTTKASARKRATLHKTAAATQAVIPETAVKPDPGPELVEKRPETYAAFSTNRPELPLSVDYEFSLFGDVIDRLQTLASDEEIERNERTLREIMRTTHWLRDALDMVFAAWMGAKSDRRPLKPRDVIGVFHQHDAWCLIADGMYNTKELG